MGISRSLCILYFVAAVVAGGQRQDMSHNNPVKDTDAVLPRRATNKYIIELEDSDVYNIAYQLGSKGRENGSYYQSFNCPDIFTGVALQTDSDNADSLGRLKGVKSVWPMSTVPLVPIIKSQSPITEAKLSNYSMHQWTGVDKLHEAGIRGEGAIVAIIDTGIDYTHQALGGCFGPGCKVEGGYDLVGKNWDPHDDRRFPKRPDNDPVDRYGHGTHVAGIVAADNEWLTGVAPDAQLRIYKVFADTPWDTDEATLMQAFCDAYSGGADVITASIGQPDGFEDNPWAVVASRIVDKGVVVTISAGNEGYSGPFFASSGSNGHNVISVAAINVTGQPNTSTWDPNAAPIPGYFTSWGPTNELGLKPDIGAPGYEVVSTVLDQGYEEISGTSMSAPYVAGVAALYIGEHGGRSLHGPEFAKGLAKRIIASGESVEWSADDTIVNQTAPPFQVGTGLIDAYKVLHYDTQLDFEPFALMDTELFKPYWRAVITNNGNSSVTYTFDVEPQAGVNIFDDYYGIRSLFDLQPRSLVPNITLPEPVQVAPGESKTVGFHFHLPEGLDDDMLPLYGGKILVNGNNDETLSIPYGGMSNADLKRLDAANTTSLGAAYDTEKAFDTMFAGEPYIGDGDGDWAWSFNVEKDRYDFMEISAHLNYPCTNLRWDIYDPYWLESYWEYPPRVGHYGYIGSATTMRDSDMYWYYDPGRMDKNNTIAFPLKRAPRGYDTYWWFGKMANGSQIRPGNYTMRFAALRPYGNPHISDHWDIMRMEVPTIQVLPYNSTNATRPSLRMRTPPRPGEIRPYLLT